jgi:hypothetical protein
VDKQNNNENQIKKVIYIQARISSTRLSPCLKKLILIHLFFRSKKSSDPALLHVKTSNIEINNYLVNDLYIKMTSSFSVDYTNRRYNGEIWICEIRFISRFLFGGGFRSIYTRSKRGGVFLCTYEHLILLNLFY